MKKVILAILSILSPFFLYSSVGKYIRFEHIIHDLIKNPFGMYLVFCRTERVSCGLAQILG